MDGTRWEPRRLQVGQRGPTEKGNQNENEGREYECKVYGIMENRYRKPKAPQHHAARRLQTTNFRPTDLVVKI